MAAGFQLHIIADRGAAPELARAVDAALAGGADWIQVREKSAPALDLYDLSVAIGRLCRARGSGMIVNDRVDVALAVAALGVHLARRSLPVAAVRPLLGAGRLLGASVHSVADAVEAVRAGADYVTFGSVYPTRGYTNGSPVAQGTGALADVVSAVGVPVLAVGGITPENVAPVLATGAAGVVLTSGVLAEPDPGAAVARLRAVLDGSRHRPRIPFPSPRG